jgi:glycosyltransferase involved in cell wall biosynthesis
MKVIVATTSMPFVSGGASLLVDWLTASLRSRGHQVELLEFPFHFHYAQMAEQMLALRLIDLSRLGDRLIAVRTPSYLLKHPHKVLWFIHHYRAAYDLWHTQYCDIPATPEGLRVREMIHSADQAAFGEAQRIFANSQVVARRLEEFNRVAAEVLYPPILEPGKYQCGDFGDYFLYVSRLTHHKRQWLAIEALRHTHTPVKLMIVGSSDPGAEEYTEGLRALAAKHQLDGRVTIVPRWISEAEKVALFRDCLGALYMPFDEDSYGYPTLEAHHAAKPVITTLDAGGTRELILDGVNGWVTTPEPEPLAKAMDRLYLDRNLAREMGAAGRRRVAEMNIGWDTVIERLLN